jgi:hypothetical protein
VFVGLTKGSSMFGGGLSSSLTWLVVASILPLGQYTCLKNLVTTAEHSLVTH